MNDNSNRVRTKDEIAALKLRWIENPHWDIEDSEGFEWHREELKEWRNYIIEILEIQNVQRLFGEAHEAGVSIETMREIQASQKEQECQREAAHKLIELYMSETLERIGFTIGPEQVDQLKAMVDHIICAAMCGAHAMNLRAGGRAIGIRQTRHAAELTIDTGPDHPVQ